MNVIQLYCDLTDFTRFLMPKLSKEDQERFAGYNVIPVDISFDRHDLTFNMTLVIG